jgi:hypothetical protein
MISLLSINEAFTSIVAPIDVDIVDVNGVNALESANTRDDSDSRFAVSDSDAEINEFDEIKVGEFGNEDSLIVNIFPCIFKDACDDDDDDDDNDDDGMDLDVITGGDDSDFPDLEWC